MPKQSLVFFALALLLCALPAHAQTTVKVDPTENRGTWQGWGSSLAWWANAVGGRNYESLYADLFYTRKNIAFLDKQLPGLGFNIARYNVGGGSHGGSYKDASGEVREQISPNIPLYKDIQGYWLNPSSADPNSDSWDWSRDAAQRSMLKAAVARGVDHVELFSDAPMWWMNDSKSSAGGSIEAAHHGDHAIYMATVAKYARDKWKIPVTSVEPFNEPNAYWWKFPAKQEGNIISREKQADILPKLRAEMDKRGLQNIPIAASDENSIDAAIQTYKYFKEQGVADVVGKVNAHSYYGLQPFRDNKKRAQFREIVGDKPLWMTEFGDPDGGGMKLAQTIIEDINFVRPTAWIYWQPLEPHSAWGLVNGKYNDDQWGAGELSAQSGQPTWVYTKYLVFAQFTRFLRPGFQIIGSDDPNSIVFYDVTRRQLSIITANYDRAQTIEYDLSSLKKVGLSGQVTSTTQVGAPAETRGKSSDFQVAPIFVHNGRLRVQAQPDSVYSIVVNGAEL